MVLTLMASPPEGGIVSKTLRAFDAGHRLVEFAGRKVSRRARRFDDEAIAESDRTVSFEGRMVPGLAGLRSRGVQDELRTLLPDHHGRRVDVA